MGRVLRNGPTQSYAWPYASYAKGFWEPRLLKIRLKRICIAFCWQIVEFEVIRERDVDIYTLSYSLVLHMSLEI